RRQDKKPPAVAALLIAHSPRPGGHFRQGIFLLTKMRVIVGYLLPLPPQNARARGDQQRGDQDDGQPRLADHAHHAFRALAHG
ncbi:hypothetical protein, partial [Escherichia coli]|uniref:hypothetical protein n=1 Tax=Escherichia coli TaxID=562 RepID=UPI0019532E50